MKKRKSTARRQPARGAPRARHELTLGARGALRGAVRKAQGKPWATSAKSGRRGS